MGLEFRAAAYAQSHHDTTSFLRQDQEAAPIAMWDIVPLQWLDMAMQRITAEERHLVLHHKLLPYAWRPGETVFAVVDEAGYQHGLTLGVTMSGRVLPGDYRRLVRRCFGPGLLAQTTHGLSHHMPWASSRRRLSHWQAAGLTLLVAVLGLLIVAGHGETILVLAQIFVCLLFVAVVMLRGLLVLPPPRQEHSKSRPLADADLPVYTVLVPLFRETSVLRQLLGALHKLNYPADKLDIKIIVEEHDMAMHHALKQVVLSPHFDIIIVPAGKPQTKPRALTYAMHFARGSLMTIYDGEDIPQPNQLRLAAAEFAVAPENLACLQAALDLYNPAENWLTRQFAAEYAALFHVVLPGLGAYRLPFMLGGTSNHFRVASLAAVGGWDPFNVTEDADLGIRLCRHGYRSGVLKSSTFEEAPTQLSVWVKQRRRWLKGFLQTWLVHNRNPARLLRETGLCGFITVQVMTIGMFASALLHPLLLLLALWHFMPGHLPAAVPGMMFTGFGLAILVMGYASAILTSRQGLKHVGARGWTTVLLTIPVYWFLVSYAAWLALWDFIVAPFHWHKTKHGLSRFTQGGEV
jgi:glycosyltransferase XagB